MYAGGCGNGFARRGRLSPVQRQERKAQDAYQQALVEHDPSGDEPRPTRTRYRTGDPITEAVVRILEENPQGVLLARDELAAWLGSFDRYAHGASDLQFWIEVWGGEQVSLDRVGEGNITVSNPAVPLTGTIQPRTLQKKLDLERLRLAAAALPPADHGEDVDRGRRLRRPQRPIRGAALLALRARGPRGAGRSPHGVPESGGEGAVDCVLR